MADQKKDHSKDAPPALSDDERLALADHEEVIARGLETFIEVGLALQAIKEARLYRETYKSFRAYLDAKWGFSRAHGYRLIDAAETAMRFSKMSPNGDTLSNEAQARVLAGVHIQGVVEDITKRVYELGGWDAITSAEQLESLRDEALAMVATWKETRSREDVSKDLHSIKAQLEDFSGKLGTLTAEELGVFDEVTEDLTWAIEMEWRNRRALKVAA